MKYLILFILSINTALACKLSIPERDVARFLAPPVSGHYLKCEDYPEDKCHCVEAIDPWVAELIDNVEVVYLKGAYLGCEGDCESKLPLLTCELGEEKISAETIVYCQKTSAFINGKKLVNSEAKKAAREAAEKNAEDAKKAKEEKCKSFSFKGTTLKQVVAELNESLECK